MSKGSKSKAVDVEAAYAAVVNAIEAIAHIHASIPTATASRDLLHGLQTLKQRLDDYAKAEKTTIVPPKAGDKKQDKAKVKAELAASQERRDRLDREGVMLWNRSTALKQSRLVLGATRQADQPDLNQGEEGSNSATAEEKEFQQLISLVRFVAARLVELGSNTPHSHADLVRLLELYTKAVLELTVSSNHVDANAAAELAAQYEDPLNGNALSGHTQIGARKQASKALVQYYMARSSLAWLEKNAGPAKHMFQKATSELLLHDCTPREIERLACQAYDFAASLLTGKRSASTPATTKGKVYAEKSKKTGQEEDAELVLKDKARAGEDAMVWLQITLKLVMREGCLGDVKQTKKTETQRRFYDIHVSTLKAIAQASLDIAAAEKNAFPSKAETAIDEVLKLEKSLKICRAKLRLLIKRNAGESEIQAIVEACLKKMDCTQENVTMLIREMHELPKTRKAFSLRLLAMLYTGLCGRADDGGASWAYMPLLSFCYGLTSNVIDQKKLKDLLDAPTGSKDALILSAEASFACQGMLWKLGDQALKEGKFALASDWYLTSTHAVFSALSASNFPKARRKAALALLHADEPGRAEEIMQLACMDSASDHYVVFLAAVKQDDEPKSIRAVRTMTSSTGFQMDMLLWAAKQAKELDMHALFKHCLQSILAASGKNGVAGQAIDSLTVVRCLLKSALDEYAKAEGQEEIGTVLQVVQEQLQVADKLLEKRRATGETSTPEGDSVNGAAWLYKSALNFVLTGLKTWSLDKVAEVARLASSLADHYVSLAGLSADGISPDAATQARQNSLTLRYLAVSSEMQHLQHEEGNRKNQKECTRLLADTASFFQLLHSSDFQLPAKLYDSLQTSCSGLQFELLLKLEHWQDAKTLLATATQGSSSFSLLQKLADLTCAYEHCPAEVAVIAIEAVMSAAAREQGMEARRLSKFVRAIIASCLDKNDHHQAFRYFQSAASLIQGNSDYPRAEIEWLLTTAWNIGLEVFPACPEDGSAWCEQALVLSQHVAGYADMREAMMVYYRQLHQRHGSIPDAEDDGIL